MPVVAVDGRTGDGAKALADAIAAGFREPPFLMDWPHGPASRPMPTGVPPMTCAPGLNHGPMPALGLDGRAFLPIVVGFGCNLPALAVTRTLPDSRQRVLTGMLVLFVACSARLSVFLVLAHAFFPKYAGLVVFLMYVASVMIVLLVGVVLRHTMFRGLEPEPLMLALPSYQCPRALQLVRSVLLRLWGFVRGASVIIIAMIVALWLLQGIPMTAGAGVFTFRAMMWCAGAELLRLAPVAMETAMRGEDPMIAGASVTTLLSVLVAGVAAGFVGYAVGASSLVSYPALLAFGIPPVLSNTTNTVGVCGTGIGGLLSARKELTGQGRRVVVYACIGLVGGVIGGLLLLELPAKVFEFAVPPLILFSALIIALNPRRKAAARDAVARALPQSYQAERAVRIAGAKVNGALRDDPWWLWAGVSFVGVYSGYFGAAAGTLALAILDLGRIGPFHQINALKTVVGFGANISAALMFVIRGSVCWPFAIMMCIGCTIGSAIAPPITRRIPENIMRAAAVLTGIVLAVKLGWSTYL